MPEVKERPILMRGPLICATLAGIKTVTRRLDGLDDVNVTPDAWALGESHIVNGEHWQTFVVKDQPDFTIDIRSGQGAPGDSLWVRETWAVGMCADSLSPTELHPGTWLNDNGGLWYPADDTEPKHSISPRGKTRVSIHMPRWASRVELEVVSIGYERLQAITESDAKAEGADQQFRIVVASPSGCPDYRIPTSFRGGFANLWDSINRDRGYGWDANPWVRRVEFKIVEGK